MCFGAPAPPKDNSAEIARRQEEERQARIAQGRTEIDSVFSRYDDPYFDSVGKSYTDYYKPQIEDQYGDARRKLTLQLAGSGNLNSGSGARTLANLFERYQDENARVASGAMDFSNQFRGQVDAARDELYAQNRSSADPSAISAQALSRSNSLTPPTSFSPLGSAFADILNSTANAVAAERSGYRGLNTGLFNTSASSGRERTVN